jgi:hypothetical protein
MLNGNPGWIFGSESSTIRKAAEKAQRIAGCSEHFSAGMVAVHARF